MARYEYDTYPMDRKYASSRSEYVATCPRHIRGVYGVIKLKGETALASHITWYATSQIPLTADTRCRPQRSSHQLFLPWPCQLAKFSLSLSAAFLSPLLLASSEGLELR